MEESIAAIFIRKKKLHSKVEHYTTKGVWELFYLFRKKPTDIVLPSLLVL